MPAAKPSRQEVMNAGPHHAKIRVTANVASSVYVAGSEISGKMDVECRAERGSGLGTIMVELIAFQELNSRDHAATSTFIHTRRLFQGPGLPPSNAVLSEDEKGILPPHHFPARRGITTFFYRFPLPLTSPASVDFGSGLAKIRYEVRASASVAWKGERRLVTDSQEVHVVESAMQEVESAGTVVGESGKIWVQGKVLGGAVIAGQTCCVELHVKNHSSRKTTGVNLTLQRMLHLDNPPPQHANLILSDTLITAAFHSAEYCCPPGLEGVAKLVVNIPRTARTVKGGSRESGEAGADKAIPALFDIRGSVNVRLCMGVGSKDLELNLPVVISHPAALATEPHSQGLPNQDPALMRAHSVYDPSRSPFPPPSPLLSQPTGYSAYPLAASPTLPYTQLYFPPPSPQLPQILNQFPAPPTSPSLRMSPVLQMSPGHAMSPLLPMSPVHSLSPVLPGVPIPPMSPGPSVSPVPYPQSMSPVHAYHSQPPFQQPQVYSPPRSPVHPGNHQSPQSPQSPRRALPQPPQRKPQSKPKGPAPIPPPLPPRPTSAEPHVHEVGVDLPPPNPASGTPLSPSAGRIQAAAEVPDPVEGKGTWASRISEHLKMSSRTRSMSPTGRRFPIPPARPVPVESPPPEIVADMEPRAPSPQLVHTALVEVMDQAGSADGNVARTQAQDLERMAVEDELEKAAVQKTREAQRMNRKSPERSPRKSEQSQPPPGPRGGRESRSPGRALPRPPSRTGGGPRPSPPVSPTKLSNRPPTSPKKLPQSISAPAVASKIEDPPAPIVKPLEPMFSGLAALERRLTTKLEHPPLPTSPVRKAVQQLEQSAPPPKEESTIDWGEIARIGKLKSFAVANKKPTIPAFTMPEIPPASFVKPRSMVARKPVPSVYEDEDLPILSDHRTPTSSLPPSPRNPPAPIAEAKPLVRYELTDKPTPKATSELSTPGPLTSATHSPVQSPSRKLPTPPSPQPASSPAVPQPYQEAHHEVPGSPSRPKPGSRPVSFQSSVPTHTAAPSSHPPSPLASPMSEVRPLVRYELSDNPVPKASSQPGTPKSVTSSVQLPSQPPAQPARVPAQPPRIPVQRASVPVPPRLSQDQISPPVATPPQSRPASRPVSVAVASSPVAESKSLVRYELSDNPVPKPRLRPKAPESAPSPARVPVPALTKRPKTQVASWPPPAGGPQPVAAPPQTQIQGGSRHATPTVISSPVIETQPLGPSDLMYEPISFTPIQPTAPDTPADTPQSPVRSHPGLVNTSQVPRDNVDRPITSPTRPRLDSRSQSWAPATNPTIPNHIPRYQLSDGPVSKAPVRYQLDDPPVSKPPAVSPVPTPVSGPEAILTSQRANLRPVSSVGAAPQPKVRPRTPPSPIPAASVPLPQSPTKVVVPPRPVTASRPAPPPFPRPEDRANLVPSPSAQPTSPKRRDPSPRRARAQDIPVQPTIPTEGDVFGNDQRIIPPPSAQPASPKRRDLSPRRVRPQDTPTQPAIPTDGDVFGSDQRIPNPQRAVVESQAAQRAKYFESLATAKRNNSPEKPQPVPQNARQILQPRQANTNQPSIGTRHVQVQIQPGTSQHQLPPSLPQSPPRMVPIRVAPSPLEISSPRPLPSPRAVYASPILNRDMPLRSPSPVFTANPVAPTPPTARSLIPITSSGFEVPVVLPGRDARERADAALREAELFRLKREAITRVPMWLGNEYTPQAPPPSRVVRSLNPMELPPQSYWDVQQPDLEEPTMSELLSRESTPVSRTSYDPQLRHPRPRPVSSKAPPALLPSDKEQGKYEVQKSARGGRGGQVTAVTSIWENGKGVPAPAPALEWKPQKRFTAPVGMFGITAKGISLDEEPSMTKSTSVPAMVYTSQAVPVLSSAASLARPVGGPGARARMMTFAPSIPESQSDDALMRKTSQSSDNIPVGQARLRELIGKYQS